MKKFLFDKGFCTDNNLILVARENEFSVQSENNEDFIVSLKVHGTQPGDVGLESSISKKIGNGEHPSYEIRLTEDLSINLYLVSMGNPHGVCWEEIDGNLRLNHVFELINATKAFQNDVNIEFCKKESNKALSLRVFERGVGETEACGSGACAAAVSGILNGFLSANELIEVKMRGVHCLRSGMVNYCLRFCCRALQPQFSMESFMCKTCQYCRNRVNVKSSIEEQKSENFC